MASRGTDVIYNGIELHNVTTKQWDQQVVYDDSNTDPIAIRFTLSFEGLLHLQNEAGIGTDLSDVPAWIGNSASQTAPTNTFASSIQVVHEALSTPRKELIINMNGKRVLRVVPPSSGVLSGVSDFDTENGPKPQFVKVMHVVSNKMARVQFSISVAILGCESGGSRSTPVINNRWSVSEEMDDDFFTTRTTSGTIRFSLSDPKDGGGPHWYKYFVIPGLENGFRRARVHYIASEDGLSAKYTIIDRQIHTAAPWPATRITGRHTESTGDGITFIRECHVRLEGDPGSDKRLLAQRAIQVVENRIPVLAKEWGAEEGNVWTPIQMSMTDNFGERNSVEVMVRISHPPSTEDDKSEQAKLGNLIKKGFGSPIGSLPAVPNQPTDYKQNVSPNPPLYGFTSVGNGAARTPAEKFIKHCYLQTQCSEQHAIGNAKDTSVSSDDGESQDTETQVTSQLTYQLPEDSTGDYFSTDNPDLKASPYQFSRMESTYFYNSLKTQMPIARESIPLAGAPQGAEKDTSVVFTLGSRQCRREIRVDAERLNDWPQIPEPKETYTDGNLKGARLRFFHRNHPPTLTADGRSKLFRITAYYLYALNRPPLDTEELTIGALPFTSLKASDEKFKLKDAFSDKLGIP